MPVQIVNGRPVTLDDFAELYTGTPGVSPDQVQTNLFLHAPSGGYDYLKDQWGKLGIPDAPEKYFARPEIQAALSARRGGPVSSPSVPAAAPIGPQIPPYLTPRDPQSRSWGTFNNDDERNIAIGAGVYDPNYLNPYAKTLATQLAALRQSDQVQRQGYDVKMFGDKPGTVQSQLAGDVTGTAAKMLRSFAGQDPRIAGAPLTPYVPAGASNPLDVAGQSTLDRTVFDHPEFQQLLSRNPHQAEFVYQRLTNRPLYDKQDEQGQVLAKGDLTRAREFRDDRAKFAQGLDDTRTKTLMENALGFQKEAQEKSIKDALLPETTGRKFVEQNTNAVYDPTTGKWKVWDIGEPPYDPNNSGGNILTGQAPKPFKQLRGATDYENEALNKHWTPVTGQTLPQAPKYNNGDLRRLTELKNDPQWSPVIGQAERDMGRSLTLAEINKLIMVHQIKDLSNQQQLQQHGAMNYARARGNALLGLKGTDPTTGNPIDPLDSMGLLLRQGLAIPTLGGSLAIPDHTPNTNLNWWGQFMHDPVGSGGRAIDKTLSLPDNYLIDPATGRPRM